MNKENVRELDFDEESRFTGGILSYLDKEEPNEWEYLSMCGLFGGQMAMDIWMMHIAKENEKDVKWYGIFSNMVKISRALDRQVNREDYYEQSLQLQMDYDLLIAACRAMIFQFYTIHRQAKRIPREIYKAMEILRLAQNEQAIVNALESVIPTMEESLSWKALFAQKGKEAFAIRKKEALSVCRQKDAGKNGIQ